MFEINTIKCTYTFLIINSITKTIRIIVVYFVQVNVKPWQNIHNTLIPTNIITFAIIYHNRVSHQKFGT